MDIYLDANATTPVLPEAQTAALAAMAEQFGNPSSVHGTGLRARALVDEVRACGRRVLGAPSGQLLFLSGATEGIQTAVLSALTALRQRGAPSDTLLLYGATEHKAVPEAIHHWNELLNLDLPVLAIPVGSDGRHDLNWLSRHAPGAGLVCTMAANNETGVVSDLAGIARVLAGSGALWMVDSVQALGKMELRLADLPIDYAPFSGHKLYAPKGIGMLYVRAGAPFTPLLAGGGQESALRSGTENVPGIAALGAVLTALETGRLVKPAQVLQAHRERLCEALRDAFPDVVFNAPASISLPTTLTLSVPSVSSKLLLDLFDAAQVRVSGGSACSAAKARPSHVLEAMGLPAWQTASAVRLSFGPASDEDLILEACRRIRACGASLREGRLAAEPASRSEPLEPLDDRAAVEATPTSLAAILSAHPRVVLVDVREPYEQRLGQRPRIEAAHLRHQAVPLSRLLDGMPKWLDLPDDTCVLFFCRSGNRSAQAAQALRRRGRANAWSLAGGLALWPATRP